ESLTISAPNPGSKRDSAIVYNPPWELNYCRLLYNEVLSPVDGVSVGKCGCPEYPALAGH
ncbi:hypothetical protein ACQUJT_25070, partial [Ralstonia pseudosolanacearum]